MRPIASAGIIAAVFALVSPARAQTPAEFYRGKTINLDIGSSVGGGYDIHGRLLARHIGKHIPGNPTVVPRNIEGAGGLRLANILYNSAPRDGTSFGIVFRSIPFEPLLGNKAAQFDATKFTWIGSTSNEVSICVAWHTTGVTSIDDLRTKEIIVGSTGPNADTSIFAKVINGVLGTRMKIVTGYPGGNEISLALERGELGGRCAWSWSAVKATRISWVEQKQVHIFVQLGAQQASRPAAGAAGRRPRQDRRPNATSRGSCSRASNSPGRSSRRPACRRIACEALRAAFNATMQDKAYLADAEKAKLEIVPVAGEDIERLIIEALRNARGDRAQDHRHAEVTGAKMPEVFVSRIDDFAEGDRRIVFHGGLRDRRLPLAGQLLRLREPLPAPGRPLLRRRHHAQGRGRAGARQDLARPDILRRRGAFRLPLARLRIRHQDRRMRRQPQAPSQVVRGPAPRRRTLRSCISRLDRYRGSHAQWTLQPNDFRRMSVEEFDTTKLLAHASQAGEGARLRTVPDRRRRLAPLRERVDAGNPRLSRRSGAQAACDRDLEAERQERADHEHHGRLPGHGRPHPALRTAQLREDAARGATSATPR